MLQDPSRHVERDERGIASRTENARKTREEAIAAGFKPDLLQDSYMLPDAVVEIEPIRPRGGRIVWEWHVWDHLVQNADPSKANYGTPSAHAELVDPNASGKKIPAFWNHMNSIDYDPSLDQIILSVRGNSEVWVIDHSTTKAEAAGHTGGKYGKGGDLFYRWGNPRMYGMGTTAEQMLFDQHDVQWIEAGRAGAGNLLVFNNGIGRPGGQASSADEWIPPLNSSGNYTIAAGSAYGPKQLAWTFMETYGTQYYAEAISGAYRLPNGNTLICYGTREVLVEVTQGKEAVCQYVNPVVKEGPLAQGQTSGVDDRGHNWNAVFKVRRYSPDYPGLADKDLTPRGLIEQFAVSYVNPASFHSGPTAPGAILSAFGENLAVGEQAASTTPLPTTLAGTSVEVTDSSGTTQLGRLFYVSPRQINLVTPDGSARDLARFTIRRDSGSSVWASVAVESVAPGLFTMKATGDGVGAILGLRVGVAGGTAEVPVFRYDQTMGRFVTVPIDLCAEGDQIHLSLYGTGIRGRSSLASVSATIAGTAVPVSYAGAQSQYPGLDQVNVGPLPRLLAGKGETDLVLKVDGRTANAVKVNIR